MFTLTGAAMILIVTTWAGFEAARHLSLRPKQLRQIKLALQSLEAEIMYGHTPLAEAALKLSRQVPAPLSEFFGRFSAALSAGDTTVKEAWETSLQSVWGHLALRNGEFEILSQFGETLGKHDRHQQQKQILLALSHLEREEQDALDRQSKYEKMVKSLGFLSGLLLALLLL